MYACLDPAACWNQLVPAPEGCLHASLPNPTLSEVSWGARNQQRWENLHHRNWQTLQIKIPFFFFFADSLLLNIYQHITPLCVCLCPNGWGNIQTHRYRYACTYVYFIYRYIYMERGDTHTFFMVSYSP